MPTDAAQPPPDRERMVRDRFLDLYRADLERGKLRTLEQYQALFPGFEPGIAEELALLDEGEPDPPPTETLAPAMPEIQSEVLRRLSRRHSDARVDRDPATPETSRYRLEGEIARGGMGAIFKVWDADLRRALAMKVILAERGASPGRQSAEEMRLCRFLDEAQITGQLDHPGVVPVHELGVDADGRVYFTMRLVRGRDFASVIELARGEREGWTRVRALDALMRVCETMAFAHAKGVVHRDLKPENIMVGQFGETYVMDWGLARVLGEPDSAALRLRTQQTGSMSVVRTARRDGDDHGPSLTQEGAVMGTPFYMPPEQAAGDLEQIGPQSDVYAVGAMLYHLMTGRRPYDSAGTSAVDVVRAVLDGPPPTPHRFDRSIPAELVAICERAMERAPEARYPTMIEMAADLRAYLERRVVKAYRSGALVEFRKWIARNRAAAAAVAALVVVVTAALVAFAWIERDKAIVIAAAHSQAQEQGYFANITAASASLAAGEIVEAKRHLASCLPAMRGFEYYHLALRADASSAVLRGHRGVVTDLAFDAEGHRLASSALDGTVRVWDVASGQPSFALPTGVDIHRSAGSVVSFIDDGRLAAFNRRGETGIQVWKAASGELDSQLPLTVEAPFAIAVSPDGRRAALGAGDHSIRVIDAHDSSELATLPGHQDSVRSLAFSADGSLLASSAEDGTVRVWDAARYEQLAVAEVTPYAHSLAFAPDGRELVAGLDDGSLVELDARTAVSRAKRSAHASAVYALAFDPSGSTLASASFDKTVRLWSALDQAPIVLLGHDQPVRCLAWTSDGRWLASGSEDQTVRLWDVRRESAVTVHRCDDELLAVDISPDGRHIAIGSEWSGTIEILSAATAAVEWRQAGPEDSVTAIAFAPNGDRFASAFAEQCSVRIRTLDGHQLIPPLLGHDGSVTALAWSPDGARIASASDDKTVRFWNAADGQPIGSPLQQQSEVTALAFSLDGSRLATGMRDGTVRVCDARSRAESAAIPGDGDVVRTVAWAPDGSVLAIGGDNVIRIVTGTGDAVANLVGHERNVNSVAFSRDGTRLVSGSDDKTVRVWDVQRARLLLTLRRHEAAVTGVAWSCDGTRIASTARDSTLRIWRAPRPAD